MKKTILAASISLIVSSPLLAQTTQSSTIPILLMEQDKNPSVSQLDQTLNTHIEKALKIHVKVGKFQQIVYETLINSENNIENNYKAIGNIEANHKVTNDRQDDAIGKNTLGRTSNRQDINQNGMDLDNLSIHNIEQDKAIGNIKANHKVTNDRQDGDIASNATGHLIDQKDINGIKVNHKVTNDRQDVVTQKNIGEIEVIKDNQSKIYKNVQGNSDQIGGLTAHQSHQEAEIYLNQAGIDANSKKIVKNAKATAQAFVNTQIHDIQQDQSISDNTKAIAQTSAEAARNRGAVVDLNDRTDANANDIKQIAKNAKGVFAHQTKDIDALYSGVTVNQKDISGLKHKTDVNGAVITKVSEIAVDNQKHIQVTNDNIESLKDEARDSIDRAAHTSFEAARNRGAVVDLNDRTDANTSAIAKNREHEKAHQETQDKSIKELKDHRKISDLSIASNVKNIRSNGSDIASLMDDNGNQQSAIEKNTTDIANIKTVKSNIKNIQAHEKVMESEIDENDQAITMINNNVENNTVNINKADKESQGKLTAKQRDKYVKGFSNQSIISQARENQVRSKANEATNNRQDREIAKNTADIEDVKIDFNNYKKQANRAFAGMAAMTNIPMVKGHDFSMGVGVGYYSSESAISVGGNYSINDNVTFKASVAGSPNDWQPILGAGVAIGF
ncbi:hypothetical protein FQP88_20195 [Vibrio atlanticus]|nr:hypothetical protein FQP88_20195 [Vibrio atlanticus]